ncbi:FAD-dependent thymidylate synthase [Rickettsiales endosymbiont of Stachyamoeba lipophora]|uniref:FAD-dependent thymidylate synthase n=1 Tax=Rickettsiales endosymbiont of Stachyamoeba lipophora TaxID=2486578 RepID=UPI000F650687|nr:FAD-dependent thymidylate synthase [Rickettsiales endosymbiont of Stachyamoeba lipophora]AZL16462.1 FAD-dependent thymidylate synthase [Rickettsiales endosymbiont of Stachyamoeba lipophora]
MDKQAELAELQTQTNQTRRATVSGIEEELYTPHKVLDHGFVRVIDYMGDDAAVVQAARVSYGKGTKKVNEDRGLIFYLMRHRHTTPFEMCDIKLHIKLPIFVARQWIRHRTASVNEYSARYSILGNEFYIPEMNHMAAQSSTNRQGREELLPEEQARNYIETFKQDALTCYKHYEEMLNMDSEGNTLDEQKPSLARELARMNLNLNFYTEWYWKTNLHNLLHFIALRADPHAQYEIRVYADIIAEIVKKWVPITYEAFEEYRMFGTHISRKGTEIIKKMINGEKVTQESSGMSKREWGELMEVLNLEKD